MLNVQPKKISDGSSRSNSIQSPCDRVCDGVCVCPPLGKGFPSTVSPTFYPQIQPQGAEGSPVVASANEAPHWMIRKTYLRSTVAHAVPLLVCFHGPSCYHPETGFPPQICSSLAAALSATENTFKPYCCRRLFHLAVPSPSFSAWELS